MAREAEVAGWDGFFIWDHLQFHTDADGRSLGCTGRDRARHRADRIGPLVTPLPRRRPVKLARETVSLDHLSNGRLVLGVGIGAGPWEWDYLREETDPGTRGAMLDEGSSC